MFDRKQFTAEVVNGAVHVRVSHQQIMKLLEFYASQDDNFYDALVTTAQEEIGDHYSLPYARIEALDYGLFMVPIPVPDERSTAQEERFRQMELAAERRAEIAELKREGVI